MLALDLVRFGAVMGLGRLLVAGGWPEIASAVYAREIRRVERTGRAVEGRRG